MSRGGLSCATCTSGTERQCWGLPVRCMGTSGSGSPALCLPSQCSQPPASRAGCVVGFLASLASFPSLCSADAPGPGPSAGHRAGEGVSAGRHETGPLVLPAAAPLRLALPSHRSPPWEAAALLSPSAEARGSPPPAPSGGHSRPAAQAWEQGGLVRQLPGSFRASSSCQDP